VGTRNIIIILIIIIIIPLCLFLLLSIMCRLLFIILLLLLLLRLPITLHYTHCRGISINIALHCIAFAFYHNSCHSICTTSDYMT